MSEPVPAASRIASIRQRLLDRARARGEDFQLVLDRFAVERLLYRLSISPHHDQFLLKGALLFALWFDAPHRPTRDADFLGFLGGARCHVQWDVGFGDAVTPGPQQADYPVLLDGFAPPRLGVYPRETVFAEKLEAIATLGIANSRMKDYFDLAALIREGAMDDATLAKAIRVTFQRRGTALPDRVPFGLSEAFSSDTQKQVQWAAFLRRNRLSAPDLADVVATIRTSINALQL